MKVMPFLVANPESVVWEAPVLRCHNEVIAPGEFFTTWDYLSEISVELSFLADHEMLVAGVIGSAQPVEVIHDIVERTEVVLRVECPSTQYRQLVSRRLSPGRMTESVSMTIPRGVIANEIGLTASVVLRAEGASWNDLSPTQIGSRMIGDDGRWTVRLEGKGSSFPMSAFDFRGTGLPEGALWYLRMQPERLTDPFGAAVRLLVNSGHPRSSDLLKPPSESGPSDLPGMLRYDLLAMLLEAVAGLPPDDLAQDFEEGTLGMVLSQLAGVYFGESLPDLVAQMGRDHSRFRADLQKQLQFFSSDEEDL